VGGKGRNLEHSSLYYSPKIKQRSIGTTTIPLSKMEYEYATRGVDRGVANASNDQVSHQNWSLVFFPN